MISGALPFVLSTFFHVRAFATRLSPFKSLSDAVNALESRISRDEGGRGIGDVVIKGELLKAGKYLANMKKDSTVLILSGCKYFLFEAF